MRLLFVTAHKHLPELRGGMEVNTHELSVRLQAQGCTVGVLCGLAGRGITGLLARLQIKLLKKACPVDHGLGYPVWRAWDIEPHIHQIVERFEPDVIVIQGGSQFDQVLSLCLDTGLPVYGYLHTPDRLPLAPAVLAHPSLGFIANSVFMTSIHPEKRFAGIVRPLMRPELYATVTDRSSVVFVNPSPHKGLAIALALASARPDVHFLFVVNHREAHTRLQEELAGRPNVELVGPCTDMREVYRRAKLVLAPSQWVETWGRIATEAHFSGIPVLASNSGGLPEAVGPGGICLPADAPTDAWIAAFAGVWDDPAQYAALCEQAKAYAQRREISQQWIVDSFMDIVRGATEMPSRASQG